MKQKIKKQKTWTVTDILILGIQVIVSVVFAYLVKSVLPMKYWLIVVALLLIVNIAIFAVIRYANKKIRQHFGKKIAGRYKIKKNIIKIISMLISIVLMAGCLTANKGLGTLDLITGENYQTQLINVVVDTDSYYQELKDIEGQRLGYVEGIDVDNTEKVLDAIANTENVSVTTVAYDSVIELAEAVLNGKVEAILLNDAYRGVIEEENGSFSTDTRIIYEYEEKQVLNRTNTEVDITKDSFNIFISGIDTYGKVSTVSRSDVNMIITVNPTTKQILMTSIPRDYYVELASYGAKDKLTHAGIYGVAESMATLEELFGIEINYYAKVNFTSLIKIVDALGGITVYNNQSFTSYHTHDYYPKGYIDMDGETALEFVRERYNLANGDNDRVKNQQKVLAAMIDKVISPTIITSFSSLLDAVSGAVSTSMGSDDIHKFIQMQLNDMASWDIQQVSVTGTGTTSTSCYSMPGQSIYVMKPDYDSVEVATAQINSILNEN